MAKKYTISETALRRLVKQIVAEEVEKQRHSTDPFAEEFQEEPWFSFGEPQAVEAPKPNRTNHQSLEEEFPGWNEPFYPEFNELDSPPFLSNRKKK